MSRKDAYHDLVRRLLEADGWTITHDPLKLAFGEGSLYVDLGAEAPLAAEKEGQKIAVEVKSFLGLSAVTELERALGQYGLYKALMADQEPGRVIYLAMPEQAYESVLNTVHGWKVMRYLEVRLLLFDESGGTLRWIEPSDIGP